jgi:regulatory protein YycI of two-component signal transduction system YycFG
MQWGRAKTILILAFLLLNLTLSYQIYTMSIEDPVNIDLKDLLPDARESMVEKNITKVNDFSIPTNAPLMRELAYERVNFDWEEELYLLADPINSNLMFEDYEAVQSALRKTIPNIDEYLFDGNYDDPAGQAFILRRKYGSEPIFDVELKLYHVDQKIYAYTQDKVEKIAPLTTELASTIIPAANALENVIINYLEPGSILKEMKLGYYGRDYGQDYDLELNLAASVQYTAPSWRILLTSGTVYYVQAINGDVTAEPIDS